MGLSFSGLVVVAAVALAAPLAIGLVPGLRLPSAVLEIVAGIVVGPAVLGWAELDDVIRVFSLFGLAFLLSSPGWRSTSTGCAAARCGSPPRPSRSRWRSRWRSGRPWPPRDRGRTA